jgi:multidrug efflux pump subunit AcrB
VDEAAAAYYGLDLTQIASFIRTVFEGQISTTYRDGNDYVEVLVRYPQEYEKDMEIIKRLKVPGLDARGRVVWLPFQTVASVRETDSFPKIDRLDQERYIAVTANIDQAYKDKLVEITKIWKNTVRKPGAAIPRLSNQNGRTIQRVRGSLCLPGKAFSLASF